MSFKSWENHEVGVGYQAKGVIRQPSAQKNTEAYRIVDMSKARNSSSDPSDNVKEKKVRKSEGKRFDPVLQLFATNISDTSRSLDID